MIQTADHKTVAKGDRIYNYYDCKWGVISEDPDYEGWFLVNHDDGTSTLLNGERITVTVPCRY